MLFVHEVCVQALAWHSQSMCESVQVWGHMSVCLPVLAEMMSGMPLNESTVGFPNYFPN